MGPTLLHRLLLVRGGVVLAKDCREAQAFPFSFVALSRQRIPPPPDNPGTEDPFLGIREQRLNSISKAELGRNF